MELYRDTCAREGFESGIEMALSAILVNPQFLFRIETDPPGVAPKAAYRITDVELASRLSFFLWSSIPDDELLELAEHGELRKPQILERQVLRMLSDPRSQSLVSNFAGQWLHLRNLDSITPDLRLFPDFDDNLRQALRKETELLFEEVLRQDQSVLNLLESDHTYLNERLAKHYGISQVYGSHFRRVALEDDSKRGGLLRQGSILTVTSYRPSSAGSGFSRTSSARLLRPHCRMCRPSLKTRFRRRSRFASGWPRTGRMQRARVATD
jgi:hypothetical protein